MGFGGDPTHDRNRATLVGDADRPDCCWIDSELRTLAVFVPGPVFLVESKALRQALSPGRFVNGCLRPEGLNGSLDKLFHGVTLSWNMQPIRLPQMPFSYMEVWCRDGRGADRMPVISDQFPPVRVR